MLRIRIVSASIIAALAMALGVNAVAAATQSNGSAGQPMSLLAGLSPPHTAKADTHVKPAHRKGARFERKHSGKRSHAIAAAEPATPTTPAATPVPDKAWPTPPDNTAATVAAETAPQPAQVAATSAEPSIQPPSPTSPATQTASSAVSDETPGTIVMNGQTVEIASPDYLNSIDRAAEDNRDTSTATPPLPTMFAAPVPDDASPVGSAAWIAQVLAALGGAMAAGITAWFLIVPDPQRMFG
jgi:hypothetical protein